MSFGSHHNLSHSGSRMAMQHSHLAIGSARISQFEHVLLARFLTGLFILALFWVSPDESTAQRNRQKKIKPAAGDIIEFDDFHDGWSYGLVIELRPFLKVEVVGGSRSRKTKTILSNSEIRIIDRARKKKTSATRSWKSRDGKFKIEASLAGVEDGNVRLKKANGKIISVPLKKLGDKDQEYIKRVESKKSDNPFGGKEEEDYPDEVYRLIERRNELMADQELHLRLAKLSSKMMIGDIIKYEHLPDGIRYGIVKSLGFHGKVETVNRNGELEDDRVSSIDNWWFVDRDPAPLIKRTWNSSAGKFKIEARLIDILEGDKLVLEKPDGASITVPLSKLGKADETYVKRVRSKLMLVKNSPLAEARLNYDQDMQMLLARREKLVELVIDSNVAARDVAKMKSIPLNTRELKIGDGGLMPLSLKDGSFSISCSINAPLHANIERVSYSEKSGLVAFVVGSPFGFAPTLAVVDIESGDVITNEEPEEVGDKSNVLSISPSGKTILVYSNDHFNSQQLELWNNEDGVLKRINAVPYESFWDPKAHLFSDENGIVLNNKGDLVFFDIEGRIKPTHVVYSGSFHGGNQIQVTDDQKSVVYFGAGGSSLHVIDLETRKCTGGMRLGNGGNSLSAFAQLNSDGESATYIKSKNLTLFDLKSGKELAQHELPSSISSSRIGGSGFPMLTPTLIRTFTGSLYDTELGVEIGKIDGNSHGAQYFSSSTRIIGKLEFRSGRGGFGANTLFGAGGEGRRDHLSGGPRMVSVRYEKLDIDAITAFAQTLNQDDIVTFGEGDKIQLDLDLGNNRLNDELDGLIFDVMDEAGIEIVDRSDYVLEARYSVGKAETEKFKIIGGSKPRTRTVTVTSKTCYAKLKYRGEVIWSRSSSVSLGRPFSEEHLNQIIQKAKSLSARKLFDYKYPSDLRVLLPSKKQTFSWQ